MGTFDLWGLNLRRPKTRDRKETMTGVGGWSHFWRQGGKPSMKVGPPLGGAAGSAQLVKGTQVTATHTPWLSGSGKTAVQPGGKDQGLRQYLRWASGKGGKRGPSLGLVSFIGL